MVLVSPELLGKRNRGIQAPIWYLSGVPLKAVAIYQNGAYKAYVPERRNEPMETYELGLVLCCGVMALVAFVFVTASMLSSRLSRKEERECQENTR